MTRVLVCGGRNYDNKAALFRALDELHGERHISLIIEGGATGADCLARQWAFLREIDNDTYYAEWKKHGRAAGPIRNARMIDEGRPEVCLCALGGTGTADMVRRAYQAGVEVIRVVE